MAADCTQNVRAKVLRAASRSLDTEFTDQEVSLLLLHQAVKVGAIYTPYYCFAIGYLSKPEDPFQRAMTRPLK